MNTQDIENIKEQDLKTIRMLMNRHNIGVATPYSIHTQDRLICDPIIWLVDDLEDEGITEDEWFEGRAYKTLHERSVEEGWEIIRYAV